MASKTSSSGSVSILTVLFIVFLVLKLTGNIDWSWWWVTSPLWIPVALFLSIMVIAFLVVILLVIFGYNPKDIKTKVDNFKF
jgi:hypothetical protein